MRRLLYTLLAVLVLVALVVAGVKVRQARIKAIQEAPALHKAPWALPTAEVKEGEATRGFPALGTVETASEITLSCQIPGTIEAMGPREGVKVKAGDVLVRIDTREIEAQIEALKAQLASAKADAAFKEAEYRRELALFKEGGSSRTEVEKRRTAALAARQKVLALERQIAALEVRRGYGTIEAPLDAIIAARLAEPGDQCAPGKPVYRLTATQGARLSVALPQEVLEQVRVGGDIVLRHGSRRQVVRISRVNPSLDARAMGTVEADLEAPPFDLPSGAKVSARVILERRPKALIVPTTAVLREKDRGGKVFKVVKGHLEEVPVVIDLVAREGMAVSGDLAPGDRVVVGHESVLWRLRDGDPVL